MRVISLRLNYVFILLTFCQLLDQLTAKSRTKDSATKFPTENFQLPKITRITVNSRHGARQSEIKGTTGLGSFVGGLDSSAAKAKTADDLSFLRLLYTIVGRQPYTRLPSRLPSHLLLPSRVPSRLPSQIRQSAHVTSRRPHGRVLSRTSRVNQSINFSSGLALRLRGNLSVNEGLVEVRVNDRWGFICKDNQWDDDDANLVCRQLGFFRTADNEMSSEHGAHSRRVGPQGSFAMSRVTCNGSESQIHDCVYDRNTSCPSRRPVAVHCALNPGCEYGWLAGNGFCYKLVKTGASFDEAEAGCRSLDAYLVKIETQQENNFISSLLMAERAEGAVWTSGRRTEWNRLYEWRWIGSSHAIRFTKWFPGFPVAGTRSQPNVAATHNCIALSKTFRDINEVSQDIDYYFWMALPCIQNLPFICKKVIQANDCYEGNGSDYRGKAFITTRASLCQKWTASNRINPATYQNAGLGDHNYCRNPDGDERPWCWVDADQGRFGYCALSSCSSRGLNHSTPSSTDVPVVKVRLRDGRNEHEGRVEIWYEGRWGNVCDDQWGIQDADVVCRQLGFTGAVRTSTQLEFSSGDRVNILLDEVQCTGLENSLYECSHDPWGQHNCRSYETAGVICKPNKVCVEEKEIQCPGSHGQICVPLSYVCDKERDCIDGSDEANCSHFEVALVDGNRPSEGRIQITINNITGTVCDDDWDDRDAAVICRMLGYSTGVAQAVTGAQFGRGRGPIWLDNVDCTGDEDDLEDCDHSTWGEHNCMHHEDAGVSCMTSGRTYPPRVTYNPVVQNCGARPIRQSHAKIVGGQSAVYGAFPWQARILKKNILGDFVHSCGGTVIGQHWILSAAHCFELTSRDSLRVRVGDHLSTVSDLYEQEFAVSRFFIHPSYSDISFLFANARYDYDIALVKIHSPMSRAGLRFSNYVQPACLPTSSADYTPGLICEISGWGLSGRSTPSVLMSAMVPIRQHSECQTLYKQKLSRKMFCAGFQDGRADTCQGDSGGPLVCQINGTYTIMGITSWGHGCGFPDSPGIYTKVGELTDWILQTIRNNL